MSRLTHDNKRGKCIKTCLLQSRHQAPWPYTALQTHYWMWSKTDKITVSTIIKYIKYKVSEWMPAADLTFNCVARRNWGTIWGSLGILTLLTRNTRDTRPPTGSTARALHRPVTIETGEPSISPISTKHCPFINKDMSQYCEKESKSNKTTHMSTVFVDMYWFLCWAPVLPKDLQALRWHTCGPAGAAGTHSSAECVCES